MRALLCAALVAIGACGGTSSETPWPVEPDEDPLGPSAEKGGSERVPQNVAETPDGGTTPPKKAAQPER